MHRLCVTRHTKELAIRTEGQRADADIPADTHKANMENMHLHTKQLHSLNVCRGLMHCSAAVTDLCVSDVSGQVITATDHVLTYCRH